MSAPAGSAVRPAYVVSAGDVHRDRKGVLSVWKGNLGREEWLAAKYDWFDRGCPFGEPAL